MLRNESFNVKDDIIRQLKTIAPSVFTEGKVDMEQLKALLGEEVDDGKEKFGLSWMGKSAAIKSINKRGKGTLRLNKQSSVSNKGAENNVIVEGDNLEVLKLLQKPYFGQVKMIFIDPPYNTGTDFVYPDNYHEPLDHYLRYTGQIDENGHALSSDVDKVGRKHSNWLNMMYPRLFLARNLLKEDGVIFVSIDDDEQANLKKLMDEIFGEENFIANVVWQKKYSPQNDATNFSDMHDYILVYAKNKKQNKNDTFGWERNLLPRNEKQNSLYKNPDSDPRGDWKSSDLLVKTYSKEYDYPITTPSGRVVHPTNGRCWRMSKERFHQLVADNRIWFGKEGKSIPSIKRFLSEVQQGNVPTTWWKREDCGDNQEATQDIRNLFPNEGSLFDTPKPVRLIKRIIQIATSKDDLVLDFFAGSGTTAHAVMDLNKEDDGNRKYILVQLPEPIEHEHFQTIVDITKERVIRAAKQLTVDPSFKYFRLDSSNFREWNHDLRSEEDVKHQMEMWKNPIKEGRSEEDLLYEVLLKAGFTLTAETNKHEISDRSFYEIKENDQHVLIYLGQEVSKCLLNAMQSIAATQVYFLDEAFESDDQKKNIQLQWEDEGIAFRSI